MQLFYSYKDSDFSITHSRNPSVDPGHFLLHTHPQAELLYFVSGSGIFHVEGSSYPLSPGDLLVLQPAESHYIELDPSQTYERKVLHFRMEVLDAVDPAGVLRRPLLERKLGKQNLYKAQWFRGGSCGHYLDTMLTSGPDPRLSVLAGLIPLLYELCGIRAELDRDDAADTVENRILRYLNNHLAEPITLSDICSRFYISRSQLCRVFRGATGTTVKKYLTLKRLMRAKQYIEGGGQPTHVYLQCGFGDYSSFYRAYVKEFGEAPAKSREKALH